MVTRFLYLDRTTEVPTELSRALSHDARFYYVKDNEDRTGKGYTFCIMWRNVTPSFIKVTIFQMGNNGVVQFFIWEKLGWQNSSYRKNWVTILQMEKLGRSFFTWEKWGDNSSRGGKWGDNSSRGGKWGDNSVWDKMWWQCGDNSSTLPIITRRCWNNTYRSGPAIRNTTLRHLNKTVSYVNS